MFASLAKWSPLGFSTFSRVSNRPLGFARGHLLVMDTDAPRERPARFWIRNSPVFNRSSASD
jgi:hypothetical protein